MKRILLFFAAAITSLLFLCAQCIDPVSVLVENDSDKAIGCYISSYHFGENSLPENEPVVQFDKRIEPGKYYYNSTIDDPSILYIFDADTLKKYSWKEIREGDKFIASYQLNICKLRSDPALHYRLSYPAIDTLCCDTCGY